MRNQIDADFPPFVDAAPLLAFELGLPDGTLPADVWDIISSLDDETIGCEAVKLSRWFVAQKVLKSSWPSFEQLSSRRALSDASSRGWYVEWGGALFRASRSERSTKRMHAGSRMMRHAKTTIGLRLAPKL